MANLFLVSDTHFGHANILGFKNQAGEHLRTFSSVEEMDEHMVDRWNSVVGPEDHVWHLGDVVMRATEQNLKIVGRLNGHKRLVLGNHDSDRMSLYVPYFQKITGTHVMDTLLLSHIPVHPESLFKVVANIHGHVHNNVPRGFFGPKHFNVSVEVLDDYTPISLEDLKLRVAEQQERLAV